MQNESTHFSPENANPKEERFDIWQGSRKVGSYSVAEREALVAERKARLIAAKAKRMAQFHNLHHGEWDARHVSAAGVPSIWLKVAYGRYNEAMAMIRTVRARRFDTRTKLWEIPISEWDAKRTPALFEAYAGMIYHDHDCQVHAARYGTCTKNCAQHHAK